MRSTIVGLFLFSIFFMSGCSNNNDYSNTPEDYIDSLFYQLQEGNFEVLNLEENVFFNLETVDNGDNNYFDANFIYVISDSIKNLEYDIISSSDEENNATVTTSITIDNLEHIFELTLLETIQRVLSDDQDIHSVSHGLLGEILMQIYESGEVGTVNNIVNINLIKVNNQWSLEDGNNHSFINAITGNLYGHLSGLDEFITILDDSIDFDNRVN